MDFKKKRNNTIIFISLLLIFIASSNGINIDCNGKAFHCVNSTHFKICVDLGGGVSKTVDDFLLPCPQSTFCKQSNYYECEYHESLSDVTTTKTSNSNIELKNFNVNIPTDLNYYTLKTQMILSDNATEYNEINLPFINKTIGIDVDRQTIVNVAIKNFENSTFFSSMDANVTHEINNTNKLLDLLSGGTPTTITLLTTTNNDTKSNNSEIHDADSYDIGTVNDIVLLNEQTETSMLETTTDIIETMTEIVDGVKFNEVTADILDSKDFNSPNAELLVVTTRAHDTINTMYTIDENLTTIQSNNYKYFVKSSTTETSVTDPLGRNKTDMTLPTSIKSLNLNTKIPIDNLKSQNITFDNLHTNTIKPAKSTPIITQRDSNSESSQNKNVKTHPTTVILDTVTNIRVTNNVDNITSIINNDITNSIMNTFDGSNFESMSQYESRTQTQSELRIEVTKKMDSENEKDLKVTDTLVLSTTDLIDASKTSKLDNDVITPTSIAPLHLNPNLNLSLIKQKENLIVEINGTESEKKIQTMKAKVLDDKTTYLYDGLTTSVPNSTYTIDTFKNVSNDEETYMSIPLTYSVDKMNTSANRSFTKDELIIKDINTAKKMYMSTQNKSYQNLIELYTYTNNYRIHLTKNLSNSKISINNTFDSNITENSFTVDEYSTDVVTPPILLNEKNISSAVESELIISTENNFDEYDDLTLNSVNNGSLSKLFIEDQTLDAEKDNMGLSLSNKLVGETSLLFKGSQQNTKNPYKNLEEVILSPKTDKYSVSDTLITEDTSSVFDYLKNFKTGDIEESWIDRTTINYILEKTDYATINWLLNNTTTPSTLPSRKILTERKITVDNDRSTVSNIMAPEFKIHTNKKENLLINTSQFVQNFPSTSGTLKKSETGKVSSILYQPYDFLQPNQTFSRVDTVNRINYTVRNGERQNLAILNNSVYLDSSAKNITNPFTAKTVSRTPIVKHILYETTEISTSNARNNLIDTTNNVLEGTLFYNSTIIINLLKPVTEKIRLKEQLTKPTQNQLFYINRTRNKTHKMLADCNSTYTVVKQVYNDSNTPILKSNDSNDPINTPASFITNKNYNFNINKREPHQDTHSALPPNNTSYFSNTIATTNGPTDKISSSLLKFQIMKSTPSISRHHYNTTFVKTAQLISIERNCRNRTIGKYSDKNNCSLFYVCAGEDEASIGECPNGTVFSNNKRQCTKNLSQCFRNNQFKCLYTGRYYDIHMKNIYYICVKHKGRFIKFKFQCQDGHTLNTTIVQCIKHSVNNSESYSNAIEESSTSSSSKERVDDYAQVFECKKEGKFSHSKYCDKYYLCTINKSGFRRILKKCESGEVFDKGKNKCVDNS